ncbi:anhydro-N-acetylmuramic acid kinase [Tardiphaga sp.]|uniref:anhydro-N-acetylmuramic acid kinase n=1 Tax=Tardiphaga sp. TaxID=1926292 RepID=UPI0037DA6775
MTRALRAIGLMSGTSLDGVDVAMIETDGERVTAFGPSGYRPYAEAERTLLRQALSDAIGMRDRNARPGVLAEAERVVMDAHAEAVEAFLSENGIARDAVDIVGFHGQTVLHRPADRLTVQIGDGEGLAKRLGLPVVYDMRAADVAAGGQGAPLVPVYHRALARELDRRGPLIVVNIGGVSNITYIDGDDVLIACDTGPGNALLDDFVLQNTGQPFDANGALASEGQVDEPWIAHALENPFFVAPLPKSLDRNHFAALSVAGKSPADGAATLTALTAATIAAIAPLLPKRPQAVVVAGGGARNPTLLSMLRARVAPASVESADALGWSADAMEAQAFAFLAVRSVKRLPLTFPGTTGVAGAMTGGVFAGGPLT